MSTLAGSMMQMFQINDAWVLSDMYTLPIRLDCPQRPPHPGVRCNGLAFLDGGGDVVETHDGSGVAGAATHDG
ncbi:hypothetical protein Hypma_008951 [Hypsizygus marmoreus]|uniref:Uncharacterized protein n=1 Tax=Hypsizygus marmoreus TaxID=39966 RepID=A0A369JQI3_HYPMA|nr:hypothetical protein Hypma_008951 [Hypsizygus marmoreus]